MSPLSYRQENGTVIITVIFGDGTQRDLWIEGQDNVRLLLQTVCCAIKNSGDTESKELARMTARAWLP